MLNCPNFILSRENERHLGSSFRPHQHISGRSYPTVLIDDLYRVKVTCFKFQQDAGRGQRLGHHIPHGGADPIDRYRCESIFYPDHWIGQINGVSTRALLTHVHQNESFKADVHLGRRR